MSTTASQRIGIWVIAVVLTVGTIGSFFVIIVANNNQANDQKVVQKLQQQCQDDSKVVQEKQDKLASELTDKYYKTFNKYSNLPSKFDAAKVHDVESKDLAKGTGDKIDDNTDYSAYYIGWTPDGKVFDGSIQDGKLKMPLEGKGLIPGWAEGVAGMKIGGVREITIPSDKAYGSKGSGSIPPNSPIKFVVMAVPTPNQDGITTPESCIQLYTNNN